MSSVAALSAAFAQSAAPKRLSGGTARGAGARLLLAPRRAAAAAVPPAAARRVPLTVVARRGGGGYDPRRRGGGFGGGRAVPVDTGKLVREYALPALGLLVAASLVGPLVGGLVMGALGLGVMIAGTAAALSISWVFVPMLAAVFGLPALMAGGMAAGVFATAAAGAFLLPSLFQLALVGGGLWLGATVAQQLFYPSARGEGGIGPNGTIDVEARTVDDDWRDEMFREQKDREQELKDFDDLLRRREDFKRRGPGSY